MNEKKENMDEDDYLDEDSFYEMRSEYAPSIGMYLMDFSALEHHLNTIVADLINDSSHQLGYIVVAKLGFLDKVELWGNLYNQKINVQGHNKMSELIEEVKDIKNQLISCNQFRNMIAHANWLSLDSDNYVRTKITFNSDQGVTTFRKVLITPEIISDKGGECIRTTGKLIFFSLIPEHQE